MTIKELCKSYEHCYDCPFVVVCPYAHNGYSWNMPLDGLDDDSNIIVTRAIIETAKILTESEET